MAQKMLFFAYMKDTVGLTLSGLQPVSTTNPIYSQGDRIETFSLSDFTTKMEPPW